MKKDMLPHNEWLRSLPRKRMGVAVLLFNEKDELLVVKQSYNGKWSVTGGVIDGNESPQTAAIRETQEEIGILLSDVVFLGVEYVPQIEDAVEGVEFVFHGGTLSAEQIKSITPQEDEIDEYVFLPVEEALKIIRKGLVRRIPICLEAYKKGAPVYFEYSE